MIVGCGLILRCHQSLKHLTNQYISIMRKIQFIICSIVVIISIQLMKAQSPVPLQWNKTQLNCIRKHVARPTVHARNLFHCSLSMYDAWAVYDPISEPFLLGNTWGNFNCPFNGINIPTNEAERRAAQEEAMSYAMYRTLKHRYLS